MIRISTAVFCSCAMLYAQGTMNRTFRLDNGATVLYSTYSEGNLRNHLELYGTATASGNTIERTMTDGGNHTWLGFQLRIERIPGDGPIRFNLSMEPLGGWGFFGQKAAPRVIENGDRILLDVVQEPGTGRKLFDSFQVGIGVGLQLMPPTRSIPQMPPSGAVIHPQAPRLTQVGRDPALPLGHSDSSIGGTLVAVEAPGKGRFTFSSHAEPGYRMEATAEGNLLAFVVGADMYRLDCSGPVTDGSGAWYLWVRFEPAPEKRTDIPVLELSNHE